MRQIGKVVALAAFLGLFLGISFFGPSKDMPFSQVVITYAFQYYQFGYTDIVYITTFPEYSIATEETKEEDGSKMYQFMKAKAEGK